jgi:hypothetical protein
MIISRRIYGFSSLLVAFMFIVMGIGLILADQPAGQSTSEKWSYFEFKSGQYFKYQLTSERGLEGWVSIKVEDGGDGVFNITLAGKWMGEFSETAKLKPGMSAQAFVYSVQNFQIPNVMSSLFIVDSVITNNVTWEDGFKWAQGDKSIEINGTQEYAGLNGLVMTYSSQHFVTKKVQKMTYCVNLDLPLPLYLQCPAANDTWTYQLVEVNGL